MNARRKLDVGLALFISLALVSCRPSQPKAQVMSEPVSGDSANFPGADLRYLNGFGFDDALIKAVAQRLGCETAAKYLAAPKDTLVKSVQAIADADNVYAGLQTQWFAGKNVAERCQGINSQESSPTAGIERLLKAVNGRSRGLTFIMHGGFGSHLTKRGALNESRMLWEQYGKSLPNASDRPFRVWRIECSNSYASDERCAPEFVESLKRLEQEQPSSLDHVYLIWGYSKGGNTAIDALSRSPELRNKTLALITVGAPIGGGVAISTIGPALQQIFRRQAELFQRFPKLIAAAPGAFAMTGDGFEDYLNLLKPDEFDDVEQGSQSITPERRRAYLTNLSSMDFSREQDPVFGLRDIPVLHVASLLDIADMRPFPSLTIEAGAVKSKRSSMNADHTQEMALLASFKDYPLSDSCVALQHAVLPREYTPSGLAPQLLGLLRLDHLGLRLTNEFNDKGVPHVQLVDAIIDAATSRLAGGQSL